MGFVKHIIDEMITNSLSLFDIAMIVLVTRLARHLSISASIALMAISLVIIMLFKSSIVPKLKKWIIS